MKNINEQLQLLVRRLDLLNASCCDECCGEQVSLAQSHILSEVRRSANPPMQRVSDELGMDITTFSRQIKALEGKGLLSRRTSSEDRRVSLLELTPEGSQVLARIDSFMSERLEQIFSRMSLFERETVTRSLALLSDVIKDISQEGTIACCK